MFNLLNREFTMTVDTSKLPCGLNGAVYFVEMEADGGVESYKTNKAGAKYGTGYCDVRLRLKLSLSPHRQRKTFYRSRALPRRGLKP